MTHIHLRRVMVQDIRLNLLDQSSRFFFRYVDPVQCGLGININVLAGREVIDDMHFMTTIQVGVDNMGSDKPRATGNGYFHALFSFKCKCARKYSIVLSRPSSNLTFGSQLRIFFAFAISGWRTWGSSSGNGL